MATFSGTFSLQNLASILFIFSVLPYSTKASHLPGDGPPYPIIAGEGSPYQFFYLGAPVDHDGAADYCEDHAMRLARVRNFDILPGIFAIVEDNNLPDNDDTHIDGVKAARSIYYKFTSGELAPDPHRIILEADISLTYSETNSLRLYNRDVWGGLDLEEVYVLCEQKKEESCPEVDCGYTTNEPFEHWRIITSDGTMSYEVAVKFCESIPNGEMLPMYTDLDQEWVVNQGIDDGTYFQPLVEDVIDNNYRWPGRWHLLDGNHPRRPFDISDDEVIVPSMEVVGDAYYEYHKFDHKQVLIWHSSTNKAGFVSIREYDARALCKVYVIGENDCVPNPCQNAGTCVDGLAGYTCNCYLGFTGDECQTNDEDCGLNSCDNGGTCVDAINDFTCICASGYTGSRCKSEIDDASVEVSDCDSNPCLNEGVCINADSGYTCNCPPGYTGMNCEQAPPCTSGPCQNGAKCINQAGSYTCICPPTHTGALCHLATSACSITTCRNGGTCLDQGGYPEYRCLCNSGYTGTHCEDAISACSSAPCTNQGLCLHQGGSPGYSCSCNSGYTGQNCEDDACSPRPCNNGGDCVKRTSNPWYECICDSRYEGEHCDDEKCSCLNRGSCYNNFFGKQICSCLPGYSGDYCQLSGSDESDSQLSPAALVGVIVGATVGGIILLGLVYICLRPQVGPAMSPAGPLAGPPPGYPYGGPPYQRPYSHMKLPMRPMYWP